MPADRMAQWIKRYGDTKAVKDWLKKNPPPAGFEGPPEAWAYQEMPDDPIDDPIEPGDEDQPLDAVSRQEHDALRDQVARITKRFNSALKRSRERSPGEPVPPNPSPSPESPAPAPRPTPKVRRGVGSLLSPLRYK